MGHKRASLPRITPGEISDRLVESVTNNLTNKEYAELCQSKTLFMKPTNLLDWGHFSYVTMNECFEHPAINPSYVIFGEEKCPVQNYTPYDQEVIDSFNNLSEVGVRVVTQIMYQLCPGLKWEEEVTTPDPTLRFWMCQEAKNKNTSKLTKDIVLRKTNSPDREYCWQLINEAVIKGREARFKIDFFPLLSRELGISVHWILGMKCPLFCENEQAERLFDLYTLLPEAYQTILCLAIQRRENNGCE